jgi:hypothetical protein
MVLSGAISERTMLSFNDSNPMLNYFEIDDPEDNSRDKNDFMEPLLSAGTLEKSFLDLNGMIDYCLPGALDGKAFDNLQTTLSTSKPPSSSCNEVYEDMFMDAEMSNLLVEDDWIMKSPLQSGMLGGVVFSGDKSFISSSYPVPPYSYSRSFDSPWIQEEQGRPQEQDTPGMKSRKPNIWDGSHPFPSMAMRYFGSPSPEEKSLICSAPSLFKTAAVPPAPAAARAITPARFPCSWETLPLPPSATVTPEKQDHSCLHDWNLTFKKSLFFLDSSSSAASKSHQVVPSTNAYTKVAATTKIQKPNGGRKGRFRSCQLQTWTLRVSETEQFRQEHGHCLIPHDFPPNQSLARWAKRQRYQYKLYTETATTGNKSSMTAERVEVLEKIGFCWDAQESIWRDRRAELRAYMKQNGNADVPSEYTENRKLGVWVKGQRHQYKLWKAREHSTMTAKRVALLESVGFKWAVQRAGAKNKTKRSFD